MENLILLAETGSDITPELASRYGIQIVPMHVNFGEETLDDGSFPAEKIVEYYNQTGKLPKTSGSTPEDFEKVFDKIHKQWPESHILYLAYSAVTTCSYQSAVIAAEDRDYITMLDTKQVSVGQGAVVVTLAQMIEENPDMTLEETVNAAKNLIAHANMCFLPENLQFLHAGGRVSNAAYLGSRILGIHPVIELLDGKLIATKKYRGKMKKVAVQLVKEYAENYHLKKDCLWFVYTVGLSEEIRQSVEEAAKECGFEKLQWIQAAGVITTHGGPAAFGLAGFSQE